MAPRSSWKGYLRLSLVSVPVQAVNATVSGGGKIHLHQLHAACHNRIRYQKVCPVHGEVSANEIVYGYEHSKGQYVIVEDEDIDKLRTEADKAINIDTFVAPDVIDPMYFDGRTYYLLPDGPMGLKPYAVLLKAMQERGCYGIGQAVFSGHEQLVLVRPLGELLGLEMLHFQKQLRSQESMAGEGPLPEVKKEELRLASKLIEASTSEKFDLGRYEDTYTQKLTEVIEAKVAGKEIVRPPQEDETPVINLMDALRKSVAQTRRPAAKQTGKLRPASKPVKARRSGVNRRHAS
jgi:DNA end-binding protein Ku